MAWALLNSCAAICFGNEWIVVRGVKGLKTLEKLETFGASGRSRLPDARDVRENGVV
jgi:hypothetical protein